MIFAIILFILVLPIPSVFTFVAFTLPTLIARLAMIGAPLCLAYAYLYMI